MCKTGRGIRFEKHKFKSKHVGKPYALIRHVRFDEGATIKVVTLLYVCLVSYRNNSASLVHAVFDVSVCKANSGKVSTAR